MTDRFLMIRRASGMGLVTLLLAACAGNPPPADPADARSASDRWQSERYAILQDRAPTEPLDPARIREVVPVPEPRTMAGNYSPYTVNGVTYTVMDSEEDYRESGLASWYGEKFHGHRTSNGEIYDMYQLSAAHRSLPIPSYVRVTNQDNGRSVIVRVNDRGPFHSDRIIDLSYAAAYRLGFADRGTARVQLEAIVPETVPERVPETNGEPRRPPAVAAVEGAGHYLQIGAFADRGAAEQVRTRAQQMTDEPVFIRSVQTGNDRRTLHRVRIGPVRNAGEIDRISEALQAADLGQPYIVED